MMSLNARSAMKGYTDLRVTTDVEEASPHRLVQLLLEGTLDRLSRAKGHIERHDVARKGEQIGKAIGLIGGLRDGLDEEGGGAIAQNLDLLYEYMERRLLKANLENDVAVVDEVMGLVRSIKGAWDGIEG